VSRCLVALIAAAVVLLLLPDEARAQTCNFSFTAINFGSVDVTASASTDISGTFSASCSGGLAGSTVRVCPHLGEGSQGAGANGSPRYMKSGADTLNYNLYSDAGHTTIWGSDLAGWSGASPPQIDMTLDGTGSGSTTRTVYGRVPGSQGSARVGTYTSSFAGYAEVRYAYSTAGTCPTQTGFSSATPSFTVQASVQAMCTVNTTPINFGTVGVISANRDATGTLSVVCTRDAGYTVAIDAGLNDSGAGVNARKMTSGGESIGYQLYRDSGRSQVWGNTDGVNTKGGTGTGATDLHTVYGRVPPQTTPRAGTYTDRVVVTVTY
jgi:spore coat protein U-like protein